jgi:hypothetical protein
LVKGVIVENKSGRQVIFAKACIDTTGDGDLAAAAGADYGQTRGSQIIDGMERGVMAMTFYPRIANVDNRALRKALRSNPNLVRDMLREKASDLIDDTLRFPPYGTKPFPYTGPRAKLPEPQASDPKYIAVTRPDEAVLTINTYGRDATNALDLTAAELEVRRKAKRLFLLFKQNIPGYEEAYISTTPTQIGLRESRRIIGDYILTEEDMLTGAQFEDAILRDRIGEWDISDKGLLIDTASMSPPFEIPYRCIVPHKLDGLLVAGRCISITHEAATYFTPRDIGTVWGLGEAAGTAAALCAATDLSPRKLSVRSLQEQLILQGFNLSRI